MNQDKVKTITLKGREWEIYQAGVEQGRANGIQLVVEELRKIFFQMLDASEKKSKHDNTEESEVIHSSFVAWTDSYKPWIEQLSKKASEGKKISAQKLAALPEPASVNLRRRTASAIVGAVKGFRKA